MKSDKGRLLLKFIVVLALSLIALILAGSTWDYSNSSKFCATCHSMESATSIHKTSAHAEVSCTSCHLGVGFAPIMLFKKVTEVNQLFKTVTGSYEKPIQIRHLAPVEQSCNKCHFPKLFEELKLEVTKQFATDETNTQTTTAMLFKIGTGAAQQGIHWHVENKITYGLSDTKEIVSVELETADGRIGTYQKEGGKPVDYRQMDCLDCHNRIAHYIFTPSELADQYLLSGKLDKSVPFVKQQAVTLLEQAKDTPEAKWLAGFNRIVFFYREQYPDVYSRYKDQIDQLPAVLDEMAHQIIFPNLEADWSTYNNKLNHNGCFQCHNSELTLVADKSSPELPKNVRVDCQLCHSVPVSAPGDDPGMSINLKP